MAVSKVIALMSWTTAVFMAQGVRSHEWTRAKEVPRHIRRQASFQGGWPMALAGSICPANLVKCQGSISNPSCCPAGTVCDGVGYQYCCPDKTDCNGYLKNFPQCADPSLTMYVITSGAYFCCPRGQFGVLPLSGYGGFCMDDGSPIEASRIATVAKEEKTVINFVTTVIVTANSRSTLPNGSATTILVPVNSRTTVTETRNKIGDPTTIPQAGANTNPANPNASQTGNPNNNGGGGGSSISAGAIAGIVIGALAVLAIFTLAFVLYRRKKPSSTNDNTGGAGLVGGDSPASAHTQPSQGLRPEMTNYPIPVTPGSSNVAMASSASGYSHGQGTVGTVSPQHGTLSPPPASEPSWGTRAELGGTAR